MPVSTEGAAALLSFRYPSYSFSVNIIVLLFLVGSCTFCMYTLCSLVRIFFFLIFLFLSADENSNIDMGAI